MSSVDRSIELLSVARTALYIAQQQQQDAEAAGTEGPSTIEISTLQESDLALHDPKNNSNIHSNNTAKELLSEAVLTLNHLDETLKKLSKLVKRRGHTNDPTNDINLSMCDFQSFVKDIMEIINTTLPQAAALPLSILYFDCPDVAGPFPKTLTGVKPLPATFLFAMVIFSL